MCAIPVVFIYTEGICVLSRPQHNLVSFVVFIVQADEVFRPLFWAIFRSQDTYNIRGSYTM
jgi:hypothetical protein